LFSPPVKGQRRGFARTIEERAESSVSVDGQRQYKKLMREEGSGL
jgi:hypothetical protein